MVRIAPQSFNATLGHRPCWVYVATDMQYPTFNMDRTVRHRTRGPVLVILRVNLWECDKCGYRLAGELSFER